MPPRESTGIGSSVRPKRRVGRSAINPWAWLQILANQIPFQRLKILKRHPVNAINRAGVDGFLDALGAVTVLPNGSGTPQMGLNHEGVSGHVGAVTASDTDDLVHPNRSFTKRPTQKGLSPRWLIRAVSIDLKRKRGVGQRVASQVQASQRVTTSSIEPS